MSENESARTLSKLIGAVFVSMILLSTYLIQRSFILDAMSATREGFTMYPPQATINVLATKLDFYQPTLSIVWPLVMGMLGLSLYYLLYRRSEASIPYDATNDPYYPFGSAWRRVFGGRQFLMLLSILPVLSLLVHLVALVQAIAFFKESISYTIITLYILLGILASHGMGMVYTIFVPLAIYRSMRQK